MPQTTLHSQHHPARVAESVDAGDSKGPASTTRRGNSREPNAHRCTGTALLPCDSSTTDLTTRKGRGSRSTSSVTRDELLARLVYDAETGEFFHRTGWRAGTVATSRYQRGYLGVKVRYAKLFAHRAAWLYHYGEPVPKLIDHINGDGSDNRIENLRAADHAQNLWNSCQVARATGVHQTRGYIYARIRHRGERLHAGPFPTVADAAMWYANMRLVLRAQFAVPYGHRRAA